ncbi:MAG: Mis12 protein-domain-containing protein, partial [Olpidium bornovanus]
NSPSFFPPRPPPPPHLTQKTPTRKVSRARQAPAMAPRVKRAAAPKRRKSKGDARTDGSDGDACAEAAAESAASVSLSYMTEHLGCSPVDVIDEIINIANTNTYMALAGLAIFTEEQLGAAEEQKTGMHQIESLVEHKLDKAFDSFEMFAMRNLFTFPEEAAPLLEHYKGWDFSLTEDDARLDKEIREVQKMLLEERRKNHQLKKHINATNTKLKTYDSCWRQLNFIMGIGNSISQDTHISTAVSSVAVLLRHLTEAASTAIDLSSHPIFTKQHSSPKQEVKCEESDTGYEEKMKD